MGVTRWTLLGWETLALGRGVNDDALRSLPGPALSRDIHWLCLMLLLAQREFLLRAIAT